MKKQSFAWFEVGESHGDGATVGLSIHRYVTSCYWISSSDPADEQIAQVDGEVREHHIGEVDHQRIIGVVVGAERKTCVARSVVQPVKRNWMNPSS